jgi:hypothetical protein
MYIKRLFKIPEHKRLGINYIETGARFYFQGCPALEVPSRQNLRYIKDFKRLVKQILPARLH